MNTKHTGDLPLFGRMPAHAEWRLLECLVTDVSSFIDHNDRKVIIDICQKKDFDRYLLLNEYWGLHSINPGVQPVSTRDACLYQLASFLKKQAWSTQISEPQISAALEKFHRYESRMRDYNRVDHRLLTWSDDLLTRTYLSRMQQFIANILGEFSFKKATRYSRHGSGGTFATTSQRGHRYYKYATVPYEVTSDAVHHARRFIKNDERWLTALHEHPPEGVSHGSLPCNDVLFQVCPGNRIEFVPKETDEARTIALEPGMNVLLQLGVDGVIRDGLKRVGIDIDDQSINQRLARLGSIDNSLATLDLKGASDNISIVIIEKLFPYEWCKYLLDLRSDSGVLPDGSTVRYEKLSSMGNGYTFAVETLLFAACVYAVNPSSSFGVDSHVYGDDIVCRSSDVATLIELLNKCGFLVNEDKSFFQETYTRESCGADYYRGENIRPVFLKVPLQTIDVFAFYSLHNRLAEWFSRMFYRGQPSWYYEEPSCLLQLRNWCSSKWLLYGPPDMEEQSAYLAVPEPIYNRTQTGMYQFDRAIAKPRKFEALDNTEYFHFLCHDLNGSERESVFKDGVNTGSRFDITRRSTYKISRKRQQGRAYAWPGHHHCT